MSFLDEFKKFAIRGSVIDMAVGIIIGAAFGKITASLVNDVIMPPIGMLLGKVDFSSLAITLHEKTATTAAVTINYGAFINTVINFVIVAFALFLVIKQANRFKGPETPMTRQCPFCDTTVSLKASRCPQCTSQLTNS